MTANSQIIFLINNNSQREIREFAVIKKRY